MGDDTALDLTALDFAELRAGGKIVSIGGYAFYGKEIQSIVLPDTLVEIHRFAFAQSKLTGINIPDSVRFVGQYAFSATPLEQVTISEASELATIEQYAFFKDYNS